MNWTWPGRFHIVWRRRLFYGLAGFPSVRGGCHGGSACTLSECGPMAKTSVSKTEDVGSIPTTRATSSLAVRRANTSRVRPRVGLWLRPVPAHV